MDTKKTNPTRNSPPPQRGSTYIKDYGDFSCGHLYIVKPWNDKEIYKLGITTFLENRMYWYDPGVELIFCVLVRQNLKLIEALWLTWIKHDARFKIVQGREYFTGPVDEAIRMVEQIRRFVNDKMGTP